MKKESDKKAAQLEKQLQDNETRTNDLFSEIEAVYESNDKSDK